MDAKQDGIREIDVLWLTAGLGCDGDTIAMTAATQPSIEDVLMGALPWIPKVRLHNPFLSMENGDEFLVLLPTIGGGDFGSTIHPRSGRLHSKRKQ